MIKIITATTPSGVIGKKGNKKLLWKSQVDMKFFQENTVGSAVVMGHNTFKTLKAPLSNRTNIVLSKNIPKQVLNNVHYYNSINEIINDFDDFIVIGGEEIYNIFISIADEVIWTTINLEPTTEANYAYFPLDSLETQFSLVYESKVVEDVDMISGIPFTLIFTRWSREVENIH